MTPKKAKKPRTCWVWWSEEGGFPLDAYLSKVNSRTTRCIELTPAVRAALKAEGLL